MKRILILGNAGTGKSTLARRLGERLGIPVIHLDALSWQPGWQRLPHDVFRTRLAAAIAGGAWITDGNYALLTFDLRLASADLVIWVERPALYCIWRVFARAFKSYFSTKEHLAVGCPERLDHRFGGRLRYILNFNRVNRPRIKAALREHGPNVLVIHLRGDRQIAAFLSQLQTSQAVLHHSQQPLR